jgi:hypothetical protein
MTASRPYKRAMTRTAALREVIRRAGTQFDPVVARAFLAVSMPRLRRALGPASLVGQLPVIVTSPAATIPALAGGAARGAGTAVATGIAGAAVIAGGVAGVTATAPSSRANQHQNSTSQHAGSAGQGAAGRVDRVPTESEIRNIAADVASAPSPSAPSPRSPSSLAASVLPPGTRPSVEQSPGTAPAATLPAGSGVTTAAPSRLAAARPNLLPALSTEITDPIESVVAPPIAAVETTLPFLGLRGY